MKISPDGSSFSTNYDVDSLSERSSQSDGVQQAPSKEPSFQEQMLVLIKEIIAKLSEDRAGTEAELACCVVELAQANERLAAQVYTLSLQFVARHGTANASSNETIVSLTNKEAKNIQDSLQMMTSEERDELKRSTITSEQEKSDTGLSNLKEERAQPKSEFSVVKKNCESSIVGLKEEVAPCTTNWSLVQLWNQHVWERSRDGCVSCIRQLKLLECPPVTWEVHKKWTIFVEGLFSFCLFLGVVSTVSVITLEQEKSDMIMNLSNFKEECSQSKSESQMASEERDKLKQSTITMVQEKSDLFLELSNLQNDYVQLKSELSDVKKACEFFLAGLKAEVTLRTTQGPVVQQAKQYVWESSRDVSVDGPHNVELLKCPPMTEGVHKWSVLLVEQFTIGPYLGLGVASTVHSFEKKHYLGHQEGGWAYYINGWAYHNDRVVIWNLPKFKKGSKVTFILDLTGEGTLCASVDGKSFHELFSNMRSKVRIVKPEGGFIPAVYLRHSNDKLKFLGFESVAV